MNDEKDKNQSNKNLHKYVKENERRYFKDKDSGEDKQDKHKN